MFKKVKNSLYKGSRKMYKAARTIQDIEDLSQGKVKKVIKRQVGRKIRKESNKILNDILRKF